MTEQRLPLGQQLALDMKRLGVGLASGAATAVPGLYSMTNLIPQMVTGENKEYVPGSQWAGETARNIDTWIHDQAGVPEAQTPMERGIELAGSLLLPTPDKGGKVIKALGPILPMRQARTAAGTVAEGAVPFLAGEAITEHYTDLPTIFGAGTAQAAEPEMLVLPPEPQREEIAVLPPEEMVLPPEDKLSMGERAVRGAIGLAAAVGVGTVAVRALSAHRAAASRLEEINTNAPYSGNATPTSPLSKTMWEETPDMSGPLNSGVAKGVTQFWRNDHVFGKALNKAMEQGNLTKDAAQELSDKFDTLSHAAISGRVNNFFKTGRFGDSAIKIDTPLVVTLSKVSQLNTDEAAGWETMRVLGTKIDSLKAQVAQTIASGGSSAAIKKAGKWEGKELKDLISEYHDYRRRFPKAALISDELQKGFTKARDYLEETGLISAADKQKMAIDNPNYHPLSKDLNDLGSSMWSRLMDDVLATRGGAPSNVGIGVDVENLKLRDPDGLRAKDIGNMMYNTPRYFEDIIRFGSINKLRGQLADVLSKTTVTWNGQKTPLLKTHKKQPQNVPFVKFMSNGQARYITSPDPALLNLLKWQPRSIAGMGMGFAANQAAGMLTGFRNPLFWLFKHPVYDAVSSAHLMPNGTAMGPATRMLNNVPLIRSVLSMPVGALEANAGIGKKLWSDFLYNSHLAAETALNSNSGVLAQMLGPQNLKALSAVMRDAFERSSYNLVEQHGGVGAPRYSVANDRSVLEALDNIPGFSEAKSFSTRHSLPYRIAHGAYDAVKEAARLQFFAANTKRELKWKSYAVTIQGQNRTLNIPTFEPVASHTELRHLAQQTRSLTGDMSKIAGDPTTRLGRGVQKTLSATLYTNQWMRILDAHGRALKTDPFRYLSGWAMVSGAVTATYAQMASTEQGRETLLDMTPEQRARNLPIVDEDGNLHAFITLPNEYRMMAAPLIEGLLSVMGVVDAPEHEGVGDLLTAFRRSFLSDFAPDLMPPGVTAGINITMGADLMGANSFELRPAGQDTYSRYAGEEEAASWVDSAMLAGETLANAAMMYVVHPVLETWKAVEYNDKLPPELQKNPFEIMLTKPLDTIAYRTKEAKAAGMGGLVFDVQNRGSVANLTWEKTRAAADKINTIVKRGTATVDAGGFTVGGMGGPSFMDDPTDIIPSWRGTPAGEVWAITSVAKGGLDMRIEKYRSANAELDKLQRNPVVDYKTKTERVTQLQREKQQANTEALTFIRQMEEAISKRLGEEFTFEGYTVPEVMQ